VNDWGVVFLGIIAAATLIMAVGQIALLVAASRLSRRLALAVEMLQELKPIFATINGMVQDASKTVALAALQMERVDRLFADFAARCEDVARLIQETLSGPIRQGSAFLAAFRAIMSAVRARGARQSRPDDEDALFI
jgi:hypothetical protein